ncbi:putative F-box protein At1g32420 [Salvia splendens]|uniref:putative F-box protein At1g32420 n=1 Tax=Salvia splendens TaxID=180675 RepID=UPI001C264047|nr:putative F-box protein At1g32420 [Salvia splendens]
MGHNFFTNLPSEITTDILSRLPLRSISISKCVCKSWLNLLKSNDFELKSPPALVFLKSVETEPTRCTIFEIEDEEEADLESHDLHYIPLPDLNTPQGSSGMAGIAANGLLLLSSNVCDPEIPVYICNPITREYIVLCPPKECQNVLGFEFCVSKISGQYKVVCISKTLEIDYDSFHVYTLGTGIWRPIETWAASCYNTYFDGYRYYFDGHLECNGIMHWTLDDLVKPCFRIFGFDIETECFSIFSAPSALPPGGVVQLKIHLTIFRDCLCICYTHDYEIVIWLMKEYRVEESWTIKYKFSTIDFDIDFNVDWVGLSVLPIKVFKDGDVLMLIDEEQLIYYSNKTRTTQKVGVFNDTDEEYYFTSTMIFTPSFFSLKSFNFENVMSF